MLKLVGAERFRRKLFSPRVIIFSRVMIFAANVFKEI
jgi:hypothetical protein